ncbi:lanthionine synthetase C family protein [Nocardiopsis exhalans]|uniref:Lanthionine synthetase C family protein n=1 Tax=Nocardiopsis exhalans TaxID=163604 RepID=A0ABY5DB39_9ACTN|nr:lanthionine synthetase C family protein [Nocardiopsis exhalans]USY20703.1 lanthionine synthetase C family protein [Nocardiopsis exhalans]
MNAPSEPRADAFSLGRGAPGILLAHAARAHTGRGSWEQAHDWAKIMVAAAVPAGDRAGLYEGAPAVAFALHVADHPAYASALDTVHEATVSLIERRLNNTEVRMHTGNLPELREFDLISGLTGLGTYLLTVCPDHRLLPEVLAYLVRLTQPMDTEHGPAPGWWTLNAPTDHPDPAHPNGHGNLGLAHGITGPLALLATTHLAGITTPDQSQAMRRILDWLDTWNQNPDRSWWPEWVTTPFPATADRPQRGRPSWCYGAPGIAWAHHLAGRALGDRDRQIQAEHALLAAADLKQTGLLTEPGLCHGRTGLQLILNRIAEHALLPELRSLTPLPPATTAAPTPGLLDGQAGIDLARTGPTTWANCLLLGPTPVLQRTPTPAS